jgi:hypothetical protein
MLEQGLPWCLPGPGLGQVKSDASATSGDAGRDVDEFAADRAGPYLAERPGGEDPGGGRGLHHDGSTGVNLVTQPRRSPPLLPSGYTTMRSIGVESIPPSGDRLPK